MGKVTIETSDQDFRHELSSILNNENHNITIGKRSFRIAYLYVTGDCASAELKQLDIQTPITDTIKQLKAQVKQLEAERDALKLGTETLRLEIVTIDGVKMYIHRDGARLIANLIAERDTLRNDINGYEFT